MFFAVFFGFFGRGWCTGVDAEGDVVWHDFEMGAEGGTWRISGGTGKFAEEKGGGTWAWGTFFPDGMRGTWTGNYDSDWTGE